MKAIQLTALLLICPLVFYAQSLTGLWIGTVSSDSTTARKDQSFEIVLTQYKDKVYGYSRSTFIVNDSLYYIVKRVKGTVEGDVCEVKDDDVMSHNFPHKPDKGVKMISTFRFDKEDSVWRMDGTWKTNQTKKYYSVSGKMNLKTEPDFEKSKIIPHLEELKLAEDVAFYKETKKAAESMASAKSTVKENRKEPVVQEKKPVVTSTPQVKKEEIAKAPVITTPATEIKQTAKVPVKEAAVAEEKKSTATAATEVNKEEIVKAPPIAAPAAEMKQTAKVPVKETVVAEEKKPIVTATQPVKENKTETMAVINQPVTTNKPGQTSVTAAKTEPVAEVKRPAIDNRKETVVKEEKAPVLAAREPKKEEPKTPLKQEPPKPEQVIALKPVEARKETTSTVSVNTEVKKTDETTAVIKEKPQQPAINVASRPAIPQAATFVAERKVAAQQVVLFHSDSLELSLYDNGEVDGDTVSVLINGELVLAKQGLKTSAIKKTVYVPSGKMDSLTLVLYAENLGKYPPNTGLLVVHDGDDVYQVRFSADLQQNAAVIFRRRQN